MLKNIPTAILTSYARKPLVDRRLRYCVGWSRSVPYGGKNGVEPLAIRSRSGQPMPCGEQAKWRIA